MDELFEPDCHVEDGKVRTRNWGLFVCRTIVTEHAGPQIDSELGKGTTAKVILPEV